MIWGYGQYLPAIFFTAGAAVISVCTAWDTGLRGSWWAPALGLCALALAVELLKPVVVAKGMWFFAAVCVTISGLAEYQMVARARASVAATSVQADVKFAGSTADSLREQLAAIDPARTSAEMAPLAEAAEKAAGDCPKNMGPVQREACRALPALKSEAARAIVREALVKKIADVELSGHSVRVEGKTDEASALGAMLGLRPQTVDQWLALLLIALFQAASVGAARVVPLNMAGPNAGPSEHGASDEKPENTGEGPDRTTGPNAGLLALERLEPVDHELALVFLRGKGGSFGGSRRSFAGQIGWSRNKLDRVVGDLVKSGAVRVRDDGVVELTDGQK